MKKVGKVGGWVVRRLCVIANVKIVCILFCSVVFVKWLRPVDLVSSCDRRQM